MGQGGGPEERAVLGEEAHVGFCSLTIPRGRPSWPAWMGVQGHWPLCLAWPWWGPVGPDPRPISYLQALQRREWHNILKVMKGKNLQPRTLYPSKALIQI